jgi:hypothetical protein
MMFPVWAPLSAHTDGSMPTYGVGRVLQEARNATVTKEYANNPLYGDDRIVDDDNGLTGLTMTFESTGLSDEDRVAVLGEELYGTSGTSGQWVTDQETPWGGFGFVRKMRDNGVRKFEAYWTLKIKFQEESQATSTREGQISWGTPTLNGRAASLYVDSSDAAKYQLHKTFADITDAKNWLKTLANIS